MAGPQGNLAARTLSGESTRTDRGEKREGRCGMKVQKTGREVAPCECLPQATLFINHLDKTALEGGYYHSPFMDKKTEAQISGDSPQIPQLAGDKEGQI